MCKPAPACKAMLAEASHRWPDRRKTSDGICPSAAHTKANPTSDHEVGNAVDLSHDPEHGVDCHALAEHVKYDPRVKYVIFDRQIWNPSVARRWRPYTGSNPHTIHMHVSIKPGARDDTRSWFDDDDPAPLPVELEPEETVDYRYPNGTVVPLDPSPFVLVDCGQAVVGVALDGHIYAMGPGAPAAEEAVVASGFREAFVSRAVQGVPTWDGEALTIVSHLGEQYRIPIVYVDDPFRQALIDVKGRVDQALA